MVSVHWPRWPPCPYMVKNLYKSFSPEPSGLICAPIIWDRWSSKIAKMMILLWPLTFLREGQICFLMHLYGPHTLIWEKCWECIFWTSLLNTIIHLGWNLLSIGAPKKHKIAKTEPIEIHDGCHSKPHPFHFINGLISQKTFRPYILLLLMITHSMI